MGKPRTIHLFILHSFLSRLYFFIPILVLWLLEQGFSQFQVTILLAVFFLSATAAEIPTGIFSDRYGHKWAIALCGICQATGVLCLAFASNLSMALAGEFFMGVGQAFYTGSKEAYLFNILEQKATSSFYQRDYSQAKLFEFVGMGLGSLVGGTLYPYWKQLPFFLTAIAFLGAAFIAVLLEEPERSGQQPSTSWSQLKTGIVQIKTGSPNLHKLIGYYSLLFTTILVFIVTLIQPYLKDAGIPIGYFGLIFFFFQAASMLGSFLAKQIPSERLSGKFFLSLALIFAVCLIILSLFSHPFSFLVAAFIYLIWGLFIPTISEVTNRLVQSQTRATVLSAQDFLQHLTFVLLAPLLGWVADAWSLSVSLAGLGLVALVSAGIAWRVRI